MTQLLFHLQLSNAISSTATEIGSKAASSDIFSIEGGSGTSLSISILFSFSSHFTILTSEVRSTLNKNKDYKKMDNKRKVTKSKGKQEGSQKETVPCCA